MTDQTISRTIDRLERGGYVTRETDPNDERRKRVAITEPGRAIYQHLLTLEKEDAALTAAVGDVGPLREQLLHLVRSLGLPPRDED